jgi:hypothetical protein
MFTEDVNDESIMHVQLRDVPEIIDQSPVDHGFSLQHPACAHEIHEDVNPKNEVDENVNDAGGRKKRSKVGAWT